MTGYWEYDPEKIKGSHGEHKDIGYTELLAAGGHAWWVEDK